jgi:hypothetical protein
MPLKSPVHNPVTPEHLQTLKDEIIMSFQEQMQAIVSGITAGAPHLRQIESAINSVADVVAIAVPATAPVVAAIEAGEVVVNKVVDEAVSLIDAFEGVPRSPANVSPIPAIGTSATPADTMVNGVPVSDAVTAPVQTATVDNATLAAASVASAAGGTADIFSRLMALENAVVSIAPIVGKIAKEIGL